MATTYDHLYYTSYLLFVYVLIHNVTYICWNILTMSFEDQVCAADCFARNWNNPRYSKIFYINFLFENEDIVLDLVGILQKKKFL